jgi:hypothetical protein
MEENGKSEWSSLWTSLHEFLITFGNDFRICDPHRIRQQESCLVYSVGSNNDFSFEAAVLQSIGSHCEIHTFDPDDYSAGAKANNVTYHQWGIGDEDGVVGKGFLMKTLKTTMRELGHDDGRVIDIFKIDCEGCEIDSVLSWFDTNVTLRQILVEVHSTAELPRSEVKRLVNFFKTMFLNNYVIFHKEPNIHFWRDSLKVRCVEFTFLKLGKAFFTSGR